MRVSERKKIIRCSTSCFILFLHASELSGDYQLEDSDWLGEVVSRGTVFCFGGR